jgi:hypothetical protein
METIVSKCTNMKWLIELAVIDFIKLCGKYKSNSWANTGSWIYQRWDQAPRWSMHPYKHGPLDIPEVGSGA